MRINNHLIGGSDLLATIVEKIEASYSQDISLLICYGSYVTGEYSGLSDIDFFFVPSTNRGYELSHQFILDNIGYDLWPVSWDRLESVSNLADQPASILMDGEVLFASSDDDLQRLQDLKHRFTRNLSDAAVTRQAIVKYLEQAKARYFNLQDRASKTFFVDAVTIVETLLIAVACLNGAYVKKGLKRLENELERLPMVPAGFLENYGQLISTRDRAKIQHIVSELICETDKLYQSKFDRDRDNAVPAADLPGFYEEFKSTYNKLRLACLERDHASAYYAGFMIDRETQSFLVRYTGPDAFPDIIEAVLGTDLATVHAAGLEHEQRLTQLLDRHGIAINAYQDGRDFKRHFMNGPG